MPKNTWETFIGLCNAAVEAKCGLHRNDLGDTIDLADYWDEDDSEAEAKARADEFADELLEDNGFPADEEPSDGFRDDVEADASTLASAGWGTDEDYGGGCEHL